LFGSASAIGGSVEPPNGRPYTKGQAALQAWDTDAAAASVNDAFRRTFSASPHYAVMDLPSIVGIFLIVLAVAGIYGLRRPKKPNRKHDP
jgi:hypothetical protein